MITIAGNIGAGKTSLATALATEIDAYCALERFADNPFLPLVYQEPARWGMHSQLWFLLNFTQTGQDLKDQPGIIIQDRALPESFEVFTRFYHDQGHMTDEEFHLLEAVYNQSKSRIRQPDLMVFLDTPAELCHERLISRGRSAEQQISIEFLQELDRRLHLFVESWPGATIRISGRPDLRQQKHLSDVVDRLNLHHH